MCVCVRLCVRQYEQFLTVLTQCCFNAGPPSAMLARTYINIDSTSRRVCLCTFICVAFILIVYVCVRLCVRSVFSGLCLCAFICTAYSYGNGGGWAQFVSSSCFYFQGLCSCTFIYAVLIFMIWILHVCAAFISASLLVYVYMCGLSFQGLCLCTFIWAAYISRLYACVRLYFWPFFHALCTCICAVYIFRRYVCVR